MRSCYIPLEYQRAPYYLSFAITRPDPCDRHCSRDVSICSLASDFLMTKYGGNTALPPDRAGAIVRGSTGKDCIKVVL